METNFRGPVNAMGALEVQSGTGATVEPFDGPSMFYQGVGFPDLRAYPFNKDSQLPGAQAGFMGIPSPITVDAVPQTFGSALIVAAASVAASGTLALVSVGVTNPNPASQFIAAGVPIIPQGTASVVTVPVAIDFGFTSATTTANSTTAQVPDNTQFTAGQWIVVGSVGNAAATSSLVAQVVGISTTNFTTITLSAAPATGMCAPVGQANLYGATLLPPATQFGPSTPTANAASPNVQAGLARMHNPRESLARGLSVTVTAIASTSATYTFLATGYDVWRQLMTEQISFVNATTVATTVYGKKAFKYIQSIVATNIGTTATVSVGISDVFGLPIRADYAPHTLVVAGNSTVVSTAGFVAAVSTTGSPATNTTGDVRGTWQLSGIGGGTPIAQVATSNGALRLTIIQNPPPWSMINGTPINTVPMFGNTQSTT